MAPTIRCMTRFCMFGAIALWSMGASAGLKMRTDCQKSRTDGRVIADLGGRSPDAVSYRVLSFEPKSESGPWTFGRCLIEITKQGNTRR